MPRATPAARPDPDQLLRDLESEEQETGLGRLKIFLGYSSGVGKSFRMFDEGRRRKQRGQDVVVGAVQSKGSPEVQELLTNFEVVPALTIDGASAMNVPAILLRAPRVCLVDGLAWSNPPGSIHSHRWEDVDQLLQSGINVISSLNLQFVEEHQQQVESITGKHVSYTVPLSFLSRAEEMVIVDAPSDLPDITAAKRQQLSELREIALVLAADVIDRQLELYLRRNGIQQSFKTQERVLICLTPRTNPSKMLISAKRIAQRFHGEMIAVSVGQPDLSSEDQSALERNLESARDAGAELVRLDGEDAIEAILQFATARGITQIFIGHGQPRSLFRKLFQSPVDRLLSRPRGIDIRVFPH